MYHIWGMTLVLNCLQKLVLIWVIHWNTPIYLITLAKKLIKSDWSYLYHRKMTKSNIIYLSVALGRIINIQIWTPTTKQYWNISFPAIDFFKNNALSITINANCSNNMSRNGIGTRFSAKYVATPPSPCWACKNK